MRNSSLESFKAWLNATQGVSIPLGPSNSSSLARAGELLGELGSPGYHSRLRSIGADATFPEVAHALCSLIADRHPGIGVETIDSVYSLVASWRWADDFGEGADLLMGLAFCRLGSQSKERTICGGAGVAKAVCPARLGARSHPRVYGFVVC